MASYGFNWIIIEDVNTIKVVLSSMYMSQGLENDIIWNNIVALALNK